MNFGEIIKNKRKRMKISQTDFADLLGVTQSLICHWESGKTEISKHYLKEISQILEEDEEEIVRLWLGEANNITSKYNKNFRNLENFVNKNKFLKTYKDNIDNYGMIKETTIDSLSFMLNSFLEYDNYFREIEQKSFLPDSLSKEDLFLLMFKINSLFSEKKINLEEIKVNLKKNLNMETFSYIYVFSKEKNLNSFFINYLLNYLDLENSPINYDKFFNENKNNETMQKMQKLLNEPDNILSCPIRYLSNYDGNLTIKNRINEEKLKKDLFFTKKEFFVIMLTEYLFKEKISKWENYYDYYLSINNSKEFLNELNFGEDKKIVKSIIKFINNSSEDIFFIEDEIYVIFDKIKKFKNYY